MDEFSIICVKSVSDNRELPDKLKLNISIECQIRAVI